MAAPARRQAHAAYPSPDGSFILVANQNGKRLERIDANFATNTFIHNPDATLDLATCKTPSGQACEHPDLRPINWPICSAVDSSSRLGFITLRGGGLFVVDPRATPMTILAAYDQATVKGNGCGAIEVGGHMYVNSGGSPVNVSGTDPHHPALYGFDVYRFPLHGYSALALPNTPAPTLLLSKSGMADSHGIASVWFGRHLWALDRHGNVAEILDTFTGRWVETIELAGGAERRSGARPGGSIAARRSAVRGAARLGAAQRRPAQRHRQHAGARRHRGGDRRPPRPAGGHRAAHQRDAAAGAGTRRARTARAAHASGR